MKNDNSTKKSNASKPMLANRLFKFRAWVKEQNRMIKVFGFNEHLVFEQTWDSPSIKENIFEIEDCHIMQFTGLIDKNGTEIYEGDIVSIEYGKGIVEYSEKQAMFIINWIGDNEAYNESLAYNPRNYIYGKTRKDIEVIGNIYENPEFRQSSE